MATSSERRCHDPLRSAMLAGLGLQVNDPAAEGMSGTSLVLASRWRARRALEHAVEHALHAVPQLWPHGLMTIEPRTGELSAGSAVLTT